MRSEHVIGRMQTRPCWSATSSLLHLNQFIFYGGGGGGKAPLPPPSIRQCKVQWSKATDVEIEHYSAKSYTSLNAVIPPDAIECIDPSCSCNEHQMHLDVYFDSICNALYHTSKQTIPTSKMKCSSEYIAPGFNDYPKELHTNARNSYLTWKQMGKPRGDDTDMYMRSTRLQFTAVSHRRRNE